MMGRCLPASVLTILVACASPQKTTLPSIRIPRARPAAAPQSKPTRLLDPAAATDVLRRHLAREEISHVHIAFESGPECWEYEGRSEENRIADGIGCGLSFRVAESSPPADRRAIDTTVTVDDLTGACSAYLPDGSSEEVSIAALVEWEQLRQRVLAAALAHPEAKTCSTAPCEIDVQPPMSSCPKDACVWDVMLSLAANPDWLLVFEIEVSGSDLTVTADYEG